MKDFIANFIAKIKGFMQYIVEAREELRKVTWPSRDEVTSFTVVVVITVIFMSIFLWAIDTALMTLIKVVVK